MQKLIEKAQSERMDRDSGIAWVSAMMQQKAVEITPGMQGKPTHKEAIIVHNRTMDDYARLIRTAGFGLDIEFKDPETMETTRTTRVACLEWDDHLNGYNLGLRDRHILVTQAQ